MPEHPAGEWAVSQTVVTEAASDLLEILEHLDWRNEAETYQRLMGTVDCVFSQLSIRVSPILNSALANDT